MKKNASRGLLLMGILLAIFSVIAFVIPFPRTAVFWIAYLCGVFAILFQLYIFKTSFGEEDVRSRFYGFPIARLGVYYLTIQLIVSIAEIALSKFLPAWVVIIVNALILAFAVIGCITTETMRDEILQQDRNLKANVSAMRELQSMAASLAGQCEDREVKKSLTGLADEFRYSDPVSSNSTRDLEADMLGRMEDLQQAVNDGDTDSAKILCAKMLECLKERNRICSVNK